MHPGGNRAAPRTGFSETLASGDASERASARGRHNVRYPPSIQTNQSVARDARGMRNAVALMCVPRQPQATAAGPAKPNKAKNKQKGQNR